MFTHSKKAIPVPELILQGDWQKEEGSGAVDIESKRLSVPMGLSSESAAIRAHEYLHIKHSPRQSPNLQDPKQNLIAALEDERVNFLGNKVGVDVSACGNIKVDPQKYTANRLVAVGTYLACQHYVDPQEILPTVKDYLGKNIISALDSVIERLRENPSFESVQELAEEVYQIIEKDPPPPPPQNGKGKGDGEDEGEDGKGKSTPMLPEEMKQHSGTSRMEEAKFEQTQKDEQFFFDVSRDEPGDMTIVKLPLVNATKRLRLKIGTGKKADDFGSTFRYPERVLTDKRVFFTRRKCGLGTVLVDCSGSMSMDMSELEEIIKFSSGTLVGVYGDSSNEKGNLYIVSNNGKVCKSIPICHAENVIDFHALNWLVKQRPPFIWVSDGRTTVKGPHFSSLNFIRCFDIIKKKGVIRHRNLSSLMKSFKHGDPRVGSELENDRNDVFLNEMVKYCKVNRL